MAYISKSKYVIKVALPGMFTLNGQTYIGLYCETFDGRFFPGTDPNKVKEQLYRLENF